MGAKLIMFSVLLGASFVTGQMIELPIQDQVPKILPPNFKCPVTSLIPIVLPGDTIPEMELYANQYIVCVGGLPLVFNCSDGLFFNPVTFTCDFPYERRKTVVETEQEIPDTPQYPVPINPDLRKPEIPDDVIPLWPSVPVGPFDPVPLPAYPEHSRPAFYPNRPRPGSPTFPVHRPVPYLPWDTVPYVPRWDTIPRTY